MQYHSQHTETTLSQLRQLMPQLHPYIALSLTLEVMLTRGEISSSQYLRWSSRLMTLAGKPLFSAN